VPSLPVQALLVGGVVPVRAALRDQLVAWGAAVTSVAGEGAALRAARTAAAEGRPYDVVLVDRQVGDADGLAVAQRLRASGHALSVPLVLVTPSAMEERAAERAGITAQLVTPVRTEQLYERLGVRATFPRRA
jgi:CheY-like chemotaxis protein